MARVTAIGRHDQYDTRRFVVTMTIGAGVGVVTALCGLFTLQAGLVALILTTTAALLLLAWGGLSRTILIIAVASSLIVSAFASLLTLGGGEAVLLLGITGALSYGVAYWVAQIPRTLWSVVTALAIVLVVAGIWWR